MFFFTTVSVYALLVSFFFLLSLCFHCGVFLLYLFAYFLSSFLPFFPSFFAFSFFLSIVHSNVLPTGCDTCFGHCFAGQLKGKRHFKSQPCQRQLSALCWDLGGSSQLHRCGMQAKAKAAHVHASALLFYYKLQTHAWTG